VEKPNIAIQQPYEQLIIEGIKGLPKEVLAEIVDFVCFVRKRFMQPQSFEAELQAILVEQDLNQLRQAELAHLEQEFEDYGRKYSHE